MPGIEEATAAFAADMNRDEAAPSKGSKSNGIEETAGTPERLFDTPEGFEIRDNSPDDEEDVEDGPDEKDDKSRRRVKKDEDDKGEDGTDDEGEEDEEDGEEDDEDGEEGDGEDEEDADDSEKSEVERLLDTKLKVTIDGEPAEVSVKEAAEGYIRKETFHRNMNKLIEVRDHLGQEFANTQSERQKFVKLSGELEEQLKMLVPREPDWASLKATDPQAYIAQREAWDAYQAGISTLKSNREKAAAEAEQASSKEFQDWVRAEKHKIFQKFPQWNEPKIHAKDTSSMRRTARAAGYADEQIDQLFDSRQTEILWKASKWDRLQARKAKAAKKPSPVRSGNSKMRTVRNSGDRADQNLRRTGGIAEAARIFDGILASESRNTRRR